MSCSQPEYSGLLMSCQTVNWISRGIVVSSGSFPLTFVSGFSETFNSKTSIGLLPDTRVLFGIDFIHSYLNKSKTDCVVWRSVAYCIVL